MDKLHISNYLNLLIYISTLAVVQIPSPLKDSEVFEGRTKKHQSRKESGSICD